MTPPSLVLLPLGPEEEAVLMERLREGHAEAFEALYRRFVDRVLRLATGILGDRAAAEDAAQEAFLRVFRGVRRFRGESRLSTWIHRITTNVCLTELSRRKRRRAEPLDEHPAEAPSSAATSDDLDLAALMASLDPLKRATFFLHHVEGLSAQEIAEVLDDSRDAVLKRLQRTRRELVERLRESEPEPAAGAQPRSQAR